MVVAAKLEGRYYFSDAIGRYKSDCIVRFVTRCLGGLPSGRVLKTDCFEEAFGNDQVLFRFSNERTQLVGINISPVVIQMAATRARKLGIAAQFIACDVRHLPFRNDSFDVVLSPSTLDHFKDVESFRQSVDELSRILKPQGSLILMMDNKHYLFRWLLKLKSQLRISSFFLGRTYSLRELRTLLRAVHFEVKESSSIMHVPVIVSTNLFRWVGDIMGSGIVPRLNAVDRFLERFPSSRFSGGFTAIYAIKHISS